ncbi:MAG: anti-sigma factor family protein, partial [Pirellulales bacterium]
MPDFDEELLSAYLDGELPVDERLRVERWLAEQPDSRQLLEELRSIKNSLERLPRDRLPHDFAEHVLRQAEREVLTSRDDSASTADGGRGFGSLLKVDLAGPVDDQQTADRLAGLSWQRLRRPVLWASLTLAAGVLFMFLDRERPRPLAQRQVAMAPGEAAAPPRGEIGAPANESDEGRALHRGAVPSEPPPPASPAPRGESESETNTLGGRMAGGRSRTVEKPDEARDELEGKSFGATVKDAGKRERAGERLERTVPIMADQTLVVWCDVSPDKKYNQRFRQLLTSNSIQWNEDEPAAEASNLSDGVPDVAEKNEADRKTPLASKLQDEKLTQQAGRAGMSRQSAAGGFKQNVYFELSEAKNSRRLREAGQAALEEKAELVLVEASVPQIEAVLEELDRDDDVFQSVDVEAAADVPSQQPLERYRRGVADVNQLEKQNSAEYGKKVAQQRDKRRLATQQAGAES